VRRLRHALQSSLRRQASAAIPDSRLRERLPIFYLFDNGVITLCDSTGVPVQVSGAIFQEKLDPKGDADDVARRCSFVRVASQPTPLVNALSIHLLMHDPRRGSCDRIEKNQFM
jgi:hypothetical protein